MKHECDKTEVIDMIRTDIQEVKLDVKALLCSHHQLIGKNKFRAKLAKLIISTLTILVSVLGYLKLK